jgi:hypothetical protein
MCCNSPAASTARHPLEDLTAAYVPPFDPLAFSSVLRHNVSTEFYTNEEIILAARHRSTPPPPNRPFRGRCLRDP